MASFIGAIGEAVDTPERAWGALARHKAVRLAGILLGLACFSRLVTVILDVHRMAFLTSFDEGSLALAFGTVARGSVWLSIVIASCGMAVVLATSAITAITISIASKQVKARDVFLELVAGTTIRMPLFTAPTLVGLFLVGSVYVAEFTLPLCIWGAGFSIAMLEMSRVAGKVTARHELRPRKGILAALLTSVLVAVGSVATIYLIGGVA